MSEQTISTFGSAWGMARFLLEYADHALQSPDFVAEALSTEIPGRQTVSGLMDMRLLARDRNGEEISFPISLVIETAFFPDRSVPLDMDDEIKRRRKFRHMRT